MITNYIWQFCKVISIQYVHSSHARWLMCTWCFLSNFSDFGPHKATACKQRQNMQTPSKQLRSECASLLLHGARDGTLAFGSVVCSIWLFAGDFYQNWKDDAAEPTCQLKCCFWTIFQSSISNDNVFIFSVKWKTLIFYFIISPAETVIRVRTDCNASSLEVQISQG